jgi:hypothetical protein
VWREGGTGDVNTHEMNGTMMMIHDIHEGVPWRLFLLAHGVKSYVLVQPFVYIFIVCSSGTCVEDEIVSTITWMCRGRSVMM